RGSQFGRVYARHALVDRKIRVIESRTYDPNPGQLDHTPQHETHTKGRSAARVVDVAADPAFDEQAVGGDHVANVGQVPAAGQVAGLEGGGRAVGLDGHDLPGECRHGVVG